ncbi:MAG: ADP-forming succinate--CoA ligase subunit beta [SAR202 cluster bacterium]|nr:ADP-forming succinate--CoA ligase subunit beta [SAR202 cluster bacterium]|tara:strand:+ start:371 stop:1558 length:1188 start_codon:yes stop_codon:yes gene_type:complete
MLWRFELKLHEYQSKNILSQELIQIPKGTVCFDPNAVYEFADTLNGKVVVKAQVLTGGRGKAGGVKIFSSSAQAKKFASSILGTNLVTHQTGNDGALVSSVLVEELLEIQQELYVSISIDSNCKLPFLIVCAAGGMDIEEIAQISPEQILREDIDPLFGLKEYQLRKLIKLLALPDDQSDSFRKFLSAIWDTFQKNDFSLLEINPVVITSDGRLLAADAKIEIDDDAIFRHKEYQEFDNDSEKDLVEKRANDLGLNYIKLDGEVGCVVNGAGLAMATMDIVNETGFQPANFLDVGGGADQQKIVDSLRIILEEKHIRAILINIFGGVLRCDVVANSILEIEKEYPNEIRPFVIRMLGTNSEIASQILQDTKLNIIMVNNLNEASAKIKSFLSSEI